MCQYEAHLGPVHGLHRHPQLPKIFLTVGDWTTNVWTEDIRDSPILTLKCVFVHADKQIYITTSFIFCVVGIKMSSYWPERGVTHGHPSYSLPQQTELFTCGTF